MASEMVRIIATFAAEMQRGATQFVQDVKLEEPWHSDDYWIGFEDAVNRTNAVISRILMDYIMPQGEP